jgi:hypothetical protein
VGTRRVIVTLCGNREFYKQFEHEYLYDEDEEEWIHWYGDLREKNALDIYDDFNEGQLLIVWSMSLLTKVKGRSKGRYRLKGWWDGKELASLCKAFIYPIEMFTIVDHRPNKDWECVDDIDSRFCYPKPLGRYGLAKIWDRNRDQLNADQVVGPYLLEKWQEQERLNAYWKEHGKLPDWI